MASFQDLELDWSALCQDCTDCWTGEDLQLAAELGKTLLERNKELEIALKQHQNVIEDQAQEIEYLTKQTVALREVSDSRLRIYEQLEVSIQDLERANHRLVLDNASGKKHIKTLTQTIEGLECKCEELQTTIDDLKLQVDVLKKRPQRTHCEDIQPKRHTQIILKHHQPSVDEVDSLHQVEFKPKFDTPLQIKCSTPKKTELPTEECELPEDDTMEQMSQMMAQLRESKTQIGKDHRKIIELEEQLASVVQQNQALENQVIQLHHKDEDMKSMYDELSTLEEVRKGQMCSRCLRNIEDAPDGGDEDTSSIMEELMTPPQHRTSFHLNIQENLSSPKETGNLYKDLVEKYEALLEVHRKPIRSSKMDGTDFRKDTDEESGNGDSLKPKVRTTFSHTPTDFSEAETSSSGFSDETSNKATQTDDRPGSFLCTIADGEDCKVSIYDDSSPISSRFRNQPEYQELFKEIFTVLKTTTDTNLELPTKNDDKKLEYIERKSRQEAEDDCQSVVSSTMSEMSMNQEPTTIIENLIQSQNEPIPDADPHSERVLRPLIRQPLEYLSVEVRKRSTSRRKNKHAQRSDSPITHIIGSPTVSYTSRPNSGKKKRDAKHQQENDASWNGNTMQFWASNNRNTSSPTPSQSSTSRFEFKPSLASQELHKLKKLDLSYAEVVRKADNGKKLASRQRRK